MAGERVQRRLAAILAADVVEYSRLMGADEAGTRDQFNEQLDKIIKPSLDEHRGRLVKTMPTEHEAYIVLIRLIHDEDLFSRAGSGRHDSRETTCPQRESLLRRQGASERRHPMIDQEASW